MITVPPGPWFNVKMLSYQYRKSHRGDKTVVRSSYLHNGISYAGKMLFLYWITPWWPCTPICGASNYKVRYLCSYGTGAWMSKFVQRFRRMLLIQHWREFKINYLSFEYIWIHMPWRWKPSIASTKTFIVLGLDAGIYWIDYFPGWTFYGMCKQSQYTLFSMSNKALSNMSTYCVHNQSLITLVKTFVGQQFSYQH